MTAATTSWSRPPRLRITKRAHRRLAITVILAAGAPLAAAAYVDARTSALADHLGTAAGVSASIGQIDVDLTARLRLSDVVLGSLFRADAIEASVALDSLLSGQLGADEIRVASPQVEIEIDRTGDSDLARLVRRLAGSGGHRGGGPRLRRIVVSSGSLVAHVPGVGDVSADGVELVPDAGGVRVITGPLHLRGELGQGDHRVSGQLVLARSSAEVALPHVKFGRVLAVAGSGSITAGSRTVPLRDVSIGRVTAGGSLEVRAALDDGGIPRHVGAELAPPTPDGQVAFTLRGEHVPLRAFAGLAPHGVILNDAHANGSVAIRRTGADLAISVDGTLDGARIDHRLAAEAPITITTASVRGTIAITPDAITADRLAVEVGAAHVTATGRLRRGATPAGELDLALDLDNRCTVTTEPPGADATTLATVSDQTFADGSHAKVGKGQPNWAELRVVPAYVPAAFVSAEDGRFYDHHGFDPVQIAKSFEIDLRDHKLARGGSTISQQLVKNAFLVQRRSLDRKLQEAILTWRLEARLDKKTILERYLNIIELGPHVFGIAAAAHQWFGVPASALDLHQVAFLAALTSEPRSMTRRVRHAGGLDSDSATRVDVILHAMARDGAISRAQLEEARTTPLHFAAAALKGD